MGGTVHVHDTGEHTHRFVDLVAELNTETRGRHVHDGEAEPNSGGTVVYLSPGARVSMTDRSTMFVSIAVLILNRPKGFEHRPRLRMLFGTAMGL